jgi:hypothetical protein
MKPLARDIHQNPGHFHTLASAADYLVHTRIYGKMIADA